MKPVLTCSLVLIGLFEAGGAMAQSDPSAEPLPVIRREAGIPFLRNFSSKEYEAGTQNWAVVQDHRGVLYFADNSGVLEYDGVSWRTIPTVVNSAIRSLAVDDSGRVFVGAQGEFGYLSPTAEGRTVFISLSDSLPPEERDFADIAKTHVSPRGVYFQALDRLFLWSNHKFKIWTPQTRFHLSFLVRDQLYLMEQGIGLKQMVRDSLQLIPHGEELAAERVYFMLPYAENSILIGTRGQGLLLFDGVSLQPFPTEIDGFLIENQIYYGALLPDGTIAIGTLRSGLAIIERNGALHMLLDKTAGLQDQNVKYVFPDRQGNLWLALDNGITLVEYPSPISLFDERNGLRGSVEALRRHLGTLYLATNQGVCYLDPGNLPREQPGFMMVQGIATESWSLLSTGNTLLAAISDGVYEIRGNQAHLIRKSSGHSFLLFRSKRDTNRVFIGLRDGLATLHFDNRKGWIDEGRIAGVSEEVRSIVETREGNLWLGTRSQGFLRVEFSGGFATTPRVEHFGVAQGLPPEHGWVIALSLDEQVVFSTDKGIYRFDEARGRFFPDSSLGGPLNERGVILGEVDSDASGGIWMQYRVLEEGHIAYGAKSGTGAYLWQHVPFNRFVDRLVWAIYPEEDGVVWFGGPEGLARYDTRIHRNLELDFSALVRRVTAGGDSVIFEGASLAGQRRILSYASNAIRFQFSATSFENAPANEFQYLLDDFDKGWSEWSNETQKDYTNVPEGEYRFRVRARNIYEHVSREDSYAFEILPPWYRTWWAYTLYVISFGAMFLTSLYGFNKFRTRQLEERSRELERTVQTRTYELQEKNVELEKTLGQLRDTQNQLIVQEKLASLGALTAGIAHEIKNPLNFVNNFADVSAELSQELRSEIDKLRPKMAADQAGDIEDLLLNLEQSVRKINEHGKRADSIVRGMLLHSRGKSGEREITDINALLEECVNLAYHGIRAQDNSFNITLEKEFDPSAGRLEVVPQDLSRVIINIVNNACYATNQKKKAARDGFSPILKISTKSLPKHVEIRIRDNGPGIPKEVRDKIFNPFFTTKPAGQGTGLGLSISYDIIVQQHRGQLEVQTEEGSFTEFIITLPKNSGVG